MKRSRTIPALALLASLSSGCLRPYSPGVVEAARPPYESQRASDHVKHLERKGIVAENWLKPPGKDICAVHGMKMEVIAVPDTDGEVLYTRESDEAATKYFPNDGINYPSELYSGTRLGRIHVCPKCISAARAWWAEKNS